MASLEIVLAIWLCLAVAYGQEQSSVSSSSMPDSCNVVCNCGIGGSESSTEPQGPRNPGAPGKRGQKGEIGPTGPKGQMGLSGLKGEKGIDADGRMKSDILGALSLQSCEELNSEHGITTNGYYLIKSESGKPVYTYCDFQVYSAVGTCEELQRRHSITRAGYFRFGRTRNERRNFRFCEPIFRDVYTCEKLKIRHRVTEPGAYLLAAGQGKPFRVHCNFSSGSAVTEVWHNLMNEMQIPDCEKPGCYAGMPLYDVDASDVRRIIDNSVSCKQFIKLRCRGVLMHYSDSNGPRAFWTSAGGQKMLYWGGSRRNGYCACGETNTCMNKAHKCNCDQNSNNVVTSDEGYLTDKTKLPIKEIRVGDMGDVTEIAWHTIGKLECMGQV